MVEVCWLKGGHRCALTCAFTLCPRPSRAPPGMSKDEVHNSPFLERLLARGYEVIFFTDVLDEYMMQQLLEYDDRKFANASKDDLKLTDEDDKERKQDKVGGGGVARGPGACVVRRGGRGGVLCGGVRGGLVCVCIVWGGPWVCVV